MSEDKKLLSVLELEEGKVYRCERFPAEIYYVKNGEMWLDHINKTSVYWDVGKKQFYEYTPPKEKKKVTVNWWRDNELGRVNLCEVGSGSDLYWQEKAGWTKIKTEEIEYEPE